MQLVVRGSKNVIGNRKMVFKHAGGRAYYTTPNREDSIFYIDQDLHIRVAFANNATACYFINKLGVLESCFEERGVVEVVEMRKYRHPLSLDNLVLDTHYRYSAPTGSPGGSRSSMASTGG